MGDEPYMTDEELKILENANHILCIFEDGLMSLAEKNMRLKNMGVEEVDGELKIKK